MNPSQPSRRAALGLLALAPALALLPARRAHALVPLDAISDYLNRIEAFAAPFTQYNADGSSADGRLVILRPGRARFEYVADAGTLVLVDGGQIAIFDGRSNQPPERYPLNRTPLNLILGPRIDLAAAEMVVATYDRDGMTVIEAQDPQNADQGWIELVFAPDPLSLKGWTIVNGMGEATSVVLGPHSVPDRIDRRIFSISRELSERGIVIDR
jgi:outer membrane lipoprotein-sorting protein